MKRAPQRTIDGLRQPPGQTLLFVLLLPAVLFWGTEFIVGGLWPAILEEDEVLLMSLQSILVAIASVAFLSFIEINAWEFAVLGIIGPIVSFLVVGIVVFGSIIAGPVHLFLTVFYGGGFILGLVVHRVLRKVYHSIRTTT